MRALVLAPFPPWSPAAAENVRICHWLRALARRFEVELVGLVEAGVASPRYETAAASLAAWPRPIRAPIIRQNGAPDAPGMQFNFYFRLNFRYESFFNSESKFFRIHSF